VKLPITKRLITISEMINKTDILCDIGCDHGYLPISLLLENKINFAYCCDVNDGPLVAARKNFEKFSLSDKCEFRKGDGFKAVSDSKFDAVTICGMGGRLISRILEDQKSILSENHQIILQPMTEAHILREYLIKNNFSIEKEKISKEDRRFYNIIEVRYKKEQALPVSDIYTGAGLIDKTNPYLTQYLEKQHKKFTKMVYLKDGHEDTNLLLSVINELEKLLK